MLPGRFHEAMGCFSREKFHHPSSWTNLPVNPLRLEPFDPSCAFMEATVSFGLDLWLHCLGRGLGPFRGLPKP